MIKLAASCEKEAILNEVLKIFKDGGNSDSIVLFYFYSFIQPSSFFLANLHFVGR
jgi:hypothetical protein